MGFAEQSNTVNFQAGSCRELVAQASGEVPLGRLLRVPRQATTMASADLTVGLEEEPRGILARLTRAARAIVGLFV